MYKLSTLQHTLHFHPLLLSPSLGQQTLQSTKTSWRRSRTRTRNDNPTKTQHRVLGVTPTTLCRLSLPQEVEEICKWFFKFGTVIDFDSWIRFKSSLHVVCWPVQWFWLAVSHKKKNKNWGNGEKKRKTAAWVKWSSELPALSGVCGALPRCDVVSLIKFAIQSIRTHYFNGLISC